MATETVSEEHSSINLTNQFDNCSQRSESEIKEIIEQGDGYIIFIDKRGFLSWKIQNPPEWLKPALSKSKKLLSYADVHLHKRHLNEVNRLLWSALSQAIHMSEDSSDDDILAAFQNVESFIDKNKNENFSIFVREKHYVIYLDEETGVSLWFSELPDWQRPALSELVRIRSIADTISPKNYKSHIHKLLAAALASALSTTEKDDVKAKFNDVNEYINKCADSSVRLNYFTINLLFIIFSISL